MIYLECHETETLADNLTEVQKVSSVFAAMHSVNKSLIIDLIKGNIDHSESAADNFTLLKTVLFIENEIISDNSTFINLNSKIDFVENKVKVFRNVISWPKNSSQRVSINSFDVDDSNTHIIVEAALTSD